MIKRLFVVFLLFVSSYARADYTWTIQTFTSDSPATSCKQYVAAHSDYEYVGVTPDDSRTFKCEFMYGPVPKIKGGAWVDRYGTACTPPAVYNPATGECKKPDDACTNNDVTNWFLRKFIMGTSGKMPVDDGTCKITDVSVDKCYDPPNGAKYCFIRYHQTKTPKDDTPNTGSGSGSDGTGSGSGSGTGTGTGTGGTGTGTGTGGTGTGTGSGGTGTGTGSGGTGSDSGSGSGPSPAPSPSSDSSPSSPDDKAGSSPPVGPGPGGVCPGGTVQVGVDSGGVVICQGVGTAPRNPPAAPSKTVSPVVTTTGPDGSSISVQKVEQKNSDGSTTTTTTTVTTKPDGTKTVDVTKDTGSSKAGGAGAEDTEGDDFCKQNPMLAVCKNSSVSGSCGQTTCTGDAIQCATLRAAAALQCAQKADSDELKASPSAQLGGQIIGGGDPKNGEIADRMKGDTVDVGGKSLDATAFMPGACLADRSISILGKQVPISFASVCSNVLPLRYVFMSMAFIVSYLLVARSVLNGGV
jgi:hypothetical protein